VKFELYLHVIALQIFILTDYAMPCKDASFRSPFVKVMKLMVRANRPQICHSIQYSYSANNVCL